MTQLTLLDLTFNKVSDAAARHIALKLPNLTVLHFGATG